MKLSPIILLCTVTFALAKPEGMDTEYPISPVYPSMIIRFSTPIKLSAALGFAIIQDGHTSLHNDIFFRVEPGFSGGKLTVGRRIGNINSSPFWLVGLSGSIMQTWGNPLQGVEPEQTYVGIELSGCSFWITVNGGVYRHIIGDDGGNDWIYCLGAGVGL